MGQSTPIGIAGHAYNPATLDLLQRVLDEVWVELTEVERNQLPRSLLAERLLQAAAGGERDADALRLRAREALRDIRIPPRNSAPAA